jgi:ATP-binding cassette subfamily B protein
MRNGIGVSIPCVASLTSSAVSANEAKPASSPNEFSEFSVSRDWHTDKRTPLRYLLSHVRRHFWAVVGVFVGAIGNAGGAALMPLLTGQAFNALAQTPPNMGEVGWAALMVVVSQVMRGVLQLLRNFSSETLGQRTERDARDELYASLLGKSMQFHDRQTIGDVMARATNDVRELNLFMTPGLNVVVGSAMFLVFPIVFAPGIHPLLVIVPLFYVAAYFVLVRRYLQRLTPATENVRKTFGQLNAALAESIEGIEVVKGAAQEEREKNRFLAALQDWRAASVRQGDVEAPFLPALLLGITLALGILFSLSLYLDGQINIGDVVAFNGLLMQFQFPTFASQFAYSQMASGVAGARRILELMNTENRLDQNERGFDGEMRGDVEFRNVSFGYGPGANAITHASFRVKAGQTVALVGQTGTGKSTIAKLMSRIYDVNEGEVLVDGVNVRDWNLAALRRQISTIEQDIFLFSRTVAENIAFGCPGATQAEIEAAAKAAQAHGFIQDFKDGYATIVGERGVTLSGGQRQRIALARAFLTDPRILILDDSTSAIDSATEDLIQRAIGRAAQGRTTCLITHRLSQIRWADLIVVIKQGRITATGTHEELMERSAAYRAIFSK